MTRILLVEDSPDCQALARAALYGLGELQIASSVKAATALLQATEFDLLLIDVSLPDGDGFQFCSLITTDKGRGRPRIIFLTGRSQIADKLLGFSVGADDYVIKPFEPLELRARVKAILRAFEESMQASQHFTVGNLRLTLPTMKAEIISEGEAKAIELTPTEFKLLFQLAKQEGHIFSRDQLLNSLSEGRTHVLDRTVDSHLSRTRKKLMGCTHNVESIYGVGYRFGKAA